MTIFRRYLLPLLALALIVLAPVPAGAAEESTAGWNRESIVVAEQSSDRILVLPANKYAWNSGTAKWSWAPSVDNGLGDLVPRWTNPTEAKLAERDGQRYLLTTAAGGFAAVIPYPAGDTAYWAGNVGVVANPQSIALLPDGNVAVVASGGNWVRIYTASQGPRSTVFAQYPVVGARGVFWDADSNVLRVLGTRALVSFTVGGTPAGPSLSQLESITLPTTGGRDLAPVPGRPDALWVTTDSGVYRFTKSTGAFAQDFPAASEINGPSVTSISTHPETRQVLTAALVDGNPADTVELARPSCELTLPGAAIYKARWWN